MTAPEPLTAVQKATLSRFMDGEYAPESFVRRLMDAMRKADLMGAAIIGSDEMDDSYRRMALAAIDCMKAPQ